MVHKAPQIMLFDWDGTLTDSFHFIQSAHEYALEQMNKEKPMDEPEWFRPYFGEPREKIYHGIYGEAHAKQAQAHFEHFVKNKHTALLKPLEGAKALLESLQSSGIRLGVVSNKRPDFIKAEMSAFGWSSYFETIVGAGEAEADKPSAAPLHLALNRMDAADVALQDVWMIGDTKNDTLCAYHAGAHGIFYDYMGDNIQWCDKSKPSLIVQDCAALEKYVHKLTTKA